VSVPRQAASAILARPNSNLPETTGGGDP
jgi:hypothetical protein